MNKIMKKILISGIIGLTIGALPFIVNAAEIKTGIAESSQGVSKIPLTMTLTDNETAIDQVELSCDTSDSNVSCSFEATASNIAQGDASKTIFKLQEGFKSGDTIGYLVLTNNISSQKNITYTLTGTGKIKVNISKEVTIRPKEEEKPKNSSPNLKSLKVSTYSISPEFNPEVYEYTVYGIQDTINSVKIETECQESGCSVDSITGGARVNGKTVTLNQGENTVKINVSSEDDKNNATYTLTIIRGETGYNSAKLKDLSFGNYTLTPAFNKDTREYTLTVPNSVNSLINIIKYTAEDTKANISTEGLDNFVVGDNILKITVDNVSGSETITYTVTVKRMSAEEIEIIKYKDDEVTFRDSEGIQTTLVVVEFKVLYPEEWKKIEDGTYKFDENGDIIVEEDKKDEEKKEDKKKSNTILIIILIVVGLAIIGGSGFLIFRKKKPEKGKKNKDDKQSKDDEEKEIDETGIEEETIKEEEKDKDDTMDIDEALSDLMSTKTYNFKDEE